MIKDLLQKVRQGEISLEDAEEQLVRTLYEHGEDFLLDLHRHNRTGFPEVIYARGKSLEQLKHITRHFLEKNGQAFISLVDEGVVAMLGESFPGYRFAQGGNLVVLSSPDIERPKLGTVGVLTAGTADTPFAKECSLLLEEVGAHVIRAFDFGVSGLHRPFLGVQKTKDADVLIVFAGMDGILPTMIGSLTDKPVIAVPTPIGYGMGGQGETALRTMLQSCLPGLVVLNIGNSVGAAATAVRMLTAIKRRMNEQAG